MNQSKLTIPKWYHDREGRVLHEAETNKHHLIFPRHVYSGHIALSGFRGTGGFLQRTTIPAHRDLHANVRPPILVNSNLRNEIIKLQNPLQEMNPADRLQVTLDYLGKLAANPEAQSRNAEDAWDLMDNLRLQKAYLELGRVTLIE